MNKNRFMLAMSIMAMSLSVGCNKGDIITNVDEEASSTKKEILDYSENVIPYIESEVITSGGLVVDNDLIDKQYNKINDNNKESISYDYTYPSDMLVYADYNDGLKLVTGSIKAELASDRLYKDILMGYRYDAKYNPIDVSYEDALNRVKKLLPNDIEEEKNTENKEENAKYIFYKSKKGNFVVSLTYGETKDKVVGIKYFKESKDKK